MRWKICAWGGTDIVYSYEERVNLFWLSSPRVGLSDNPTVCHSSEGRNLVRKAEIPPFWGMTEEEEPLYSSTESPYFLTATYRQAGIYNAYPKQVICPHLPPSWWYARTYAKLVFITLIRVRHAKAYTTNLLIQITATVKLAGSPHLRQVCDMPAVTPCIWRQKPHLRQAGDDKNRT